MSRCIDQPAILSDVSHDSPVPYDDDDDDDDGRYEYDIPRQRMENISSTYRVTTELCKQCVHGANV
jgi:hypothetical protein